jgi:hypothetical protein
MGRSDRGGFRHPFSVQEITGHLIRPVEARKGIEKGVDLLRRSIRRKGEDRGSAGSRAGTYFSLYLGAPRNP